MAGSKAKQRFVALRVNEVSLVDRPANEQEFLVIKRHPITQESEKDMANQTTTKTAEQLATEEAEKTKAAAAATETVEADAEKGKGKKAPPFPPKKDGEKDEKEEEAKAKKAADELAEAEATLKAAQEKVEALKAASAPAAEKTEKAAEEAPAEQPAEKAADQTVEKGMDPKRMICQMMIDDLHNRLYKLDSLMSMDLDSLLATAKSMGVAQEKLDEVTKAVEKGKKQFSADRVEKINAALKNLLDVAKDVDGEKLMEMLKASIPAGSALQDATAGVKPGDKPSVGGAVGPDAQGHSNQSALKAEDIQKAVAEVIAPVAKKLEDVTKEIEDIKSVRGVSKAIDSDSTEKPVEKRSSLWTGVL